MSGKKEILNNENMKHILTLEKFTKQYQQKIDVKDFKKIKKGSKILYMGGQVEVMDNNGYVLKLKGKDGKTFTVNKNQFDHGGMIKEGVMDNIHLMADASKDYEDFKKKFKKGFPKIFKSTPDFMDWLYGMYKDMAPDKVEESVVNEKRINLKQAADYEKKLKKKVPSATRAKAANHNGEVKLFVNYKRFADRAKLKAAGEDLGLTYVSDGRVTNRPGLDFKRGDKMVGGGGMLGITDNWMTFIKESVNEGIVKDLKKLGDEINYLVDADDDTKKIWKKAGFDTEDDDNVILYSYVSSSWPETKKLLDKKRVKYKELEDPNSAGESYIVFKESLNEKVIKGKDAGNFVKMAKPGRTLKIDDDVYTALGKGKWEGPDGEKLNWIEVSSIASALGNKEVVYESLINEKANLKDLAKDLAELDKGKGGMSWISSITVEDDWDNKKGEDIAMISVQGGAGDSTPKAYVNKFLKKLGFKPKFLKKNNKGDIHEYIWHLTQFTPEDINKISWKDLEYYRESVVNEDYSQRARNFRVRLRARLETMKKGEKISYGKLSWTALGNGNFKDSRGRTVPYQDIVQDLKFAVQPDIMRHRGARGDEMIDAYLTFESKVNEARAKKVTKQMWKRMNDDKRFDALLSVVKDPDDAEEYVEYRWEELPSGFERDMVLFELSSQQDGTKASDGKHKHEDHLEEDIEAMWKKTYGEDFIKHYPAVAKIIRQRKINDRREIARIWQDTYGEDFEKEYPALYQKMK